MTAILLIVFGKQAKEINPNLSEEQKERELKRPERLPIKDFVYFNKYR
ncbi:hypothetical protein [Dictyoglomus sp.]